MSSFKLRPRKYKVTRSPLNSSVTFHGSMSLEIWIPTNRNQSIDNLDQWTNRLRLFYDETTSVYLIFRKTGKFAGMSSIKDVCTSAWIEANVHGLLGSQQPARVHHLGFNQLSDLIHESDTLAVWKSDIPIIHPRTRLGSPQIVFSGGITMNNSITTSPLTGTAISASSSSKDFLPDFVPIESWTVFDSIAHKQHRHTELSAIKSESLESIHADFRLPVFQALNLRLRCAKLTGGGAGDEVLATIELQPGESFSAPTDVNLASPLTIEEVSLEYSEGSVQPVGELSLPSVLHPGDVIVQSFTLGIGASEATINAVAPNLISAPVIIRLKSNVGSEACVVTKWDTTVDFDLSPSLQSPSAIGSVASMGSGSIPGTGGGSTSGVSAPSSGNGLMSKLQKSTSNGSLRGAAGTTKTVLTGLSLSFSGPNVVTRGQKFLWSVFAVNKSSVTRNISLIFHQREDTSVRKVPGLSSVNSRGIISLANDVRAGPLAPHSCYETEIPMLALHSGLHLLPDVTVIDLSSGVGYDCGRLLNVLVN